MNEEINIIPIDPTTFEIQDYQSEDVELIAKSELDTVFSSSTDYIEYYVYDENQTLLYPQDTTTPLTSFNIKQGDVLLNPQSDLETLGFDIGKYSITYDFYRRRLASNINENYFIKEISSDRTEIRLDSNTIENSLIVSSTNDFIQYRKDQPYFVDFHLNFGSNNLVIANNISLDIQDSDDPTILIKLYEPLPTDFDLKSQLWVVETLSKSQAYQVDFPFTPIIEDDFTYISGPNFNLKVTQEVGNSSQTFTYNTLMSSDITSSVSQIKSLLNEKEINVNVNYEDFNEFVHFSTALTRLENFYYKVGLIEGYTNELNDISSNITSDTTNTLAYSSSVAVLTTQIDTIIRNLDGYEYFMYFNSGSAFSYPKTNTTPPFTLASTGSAEVLTWIGSANESSGNYGGVALSASLYDESNQDRLYNAIPEYLREDPDNVKYELFVDMVSQHYDNVWLYTKDVTNKFNADNRLDYGISKDLIADAIKDFGIKLYSNNFNNTDLYSAFLGITPDGNAFPFPEMTGSLPTPSGFEYVDTQISSSDTIVPLNDINKRIYKRIYHNLPYLLKTKGTIAGLRALITSYGIPDTILRVNEFGGKDRNESQDWDLKQNVFNYAFDTGVNATNFVSSSFNSNSTFVDGNNPPQTIQFRFKPTSIPLPTDNIASSNIRYSQSLFSTDDGGNLVLEYTGSGLISGSHQGAISSPYDLYGTLKWVPAQEDDPSLSASVYLPLFNNDWWSVQINTNITTNSSSLYVANEIDGKLGFNSSGSTSGFDSSYYDGSSTGYLNKDTNIVFDDGTTYTPFSGSFQELRYWTQEISQSNFYDFTLNPYSAEGNGINTTPNQLYFRADLGTQLDTGSRISTHPRVTGSISQITQSFNGGSDFYINVSNFISNKENLYQDQVPAGIKNRVTDKISVKNLNIAEAPYGLPSGSELATISTQDAISAFQSVQQESFTDSSYTPDINYLEVAFSPTNQINDDINAQLGYFNLGDYIGDPRHISSSNRNYPNLDALRDAYFEKYIHSYDVVDFVRLIKFFDNSLFKMIKDFTPARTTLASGVVVKQHLLERNRQRPAQVYWENATYSGSVKPQSRNFDTGSGDVGQYESTGGSSIYKFTGGTGGSLERFNGLQSHPNSLNNRFNLTQSYSESIDGSVANTINNSGSFEGRREILISDQEEFYNGEFSGSNITVTDLIANPGCGPYLKVTDKPIVFNPIVFSLTPGVLTQGTTTEDDIVNNLNNPKSGDAWIISEQVQTSPPRSKVKFIKLSTFDVNNISIKNYLEDSKSIKWVTSDAIVENGNGVAEYVIEGITTFANSTLLRISQTQGDNVEQGSFLPITSSQDAGSENWSLTVDGNFTSSQALADSPDGEQQGNFINGASDFQKQYFWYYNGNKQDEQDFFNTGSSTINLENILSDPTKFSHGTYNPTRTSNIPWFFSASIAYVASDLGTGNQITSSNNIYHSASKYSGIGLYDQDFNFSATSPLTSSGLFKPSPLVTQVQASVFKDIYNNLIPGDSGSEAGELGGHPKIRLAGTASIDFHFPSLTINGTPRTIAPPISNFTALSGSGLNSNNSDFDLTFNTRTYIDFSGSSYPYSDLEDGAVSIYTEGLETYIGSAYQHYNAIATSATVTYNLHISASVSNYTASIFRKSYATGSIGDYDGGWFSAGVSNTFNASNREISVSNGQFTLPLDLEAPGYDENYNAFRIEIKSPEENFEYWVDDFDGKLQVSYTNNGTPYTKNIPTLNNDAFQSTTYHGSSGDIQEFTSSVTPSGEAFPTISIQAHLKRTGSGIPPEGYIITSSNVVASEIYGGQTFTFPDSPILGIFEGNPALTSSTVNNEDDMYFIEYSMSRYDIEGDSGNNTFNVEFMESGDTGSKIIVEQTTLSTGGGSYDLTGSIIIDQGNTSLPTFIGDNIEKQEFIVPNSTSTGRATLTGSFTSLFRYDDAFRMGVEVSKSFGAGLAITEYTMSIFPSSSVYAPLTTIPSYDNYKTPSPNGFIIPSYYGEGILPFNLSLDCQPLLNNYNDTRENNFLMDVSFNNVSGSIQPVNFTQILNNTADKASTPVSNYTSVRSIRPRYSGTKTTSNEYNIWSIQDVDTYGKNPVIELKDAYFGYFTSIKDLYPLVNDKTSLELTYLLDQQSNAIPPSLEGFGIDILEKTFPLDNPISIGFISASNTAQELDDSYPIYKITSKPTPVLYTQTSSVGYSTEIPLSGSGRISMYDNNDAATFVDYTFTAQGTSSFKDDYGTNQPFGTYTQIINPTEAITTNPYSAGTYVNPYSDGTLTFADSGGKTVDTNPQRVSMQTSFATSFIYESGKAELEFQLQMLIDGSPSKFDLEDVSLKVYRTGQEPIDAGSIVGSGINKLLRFISSTSTRSGGLFRRSKTVNKLSNVGLYNTQIGGYYIVIENKPLENFLIQKGLYTKGRGGSKWKGDITGLEFIIKANSGGHIFEDDNASQFKLKIELDKSKGPVGNVLFPDDYTGPVFPSKVSTIGERTALLAGDNIGNAPFWVYTGSEGGGSSILDKSILVMSSSNINEAYNSGFYQGPLTYIPGPSEYFDSGTEPTQTQFPKITSPIEFLPGDEIRFGNNENYSYTILSITNPESNIGTGGKGRIKIKLDRDVPQSINKDFFLVRRYTSKASSFIIDAPFPYTAESSGSSANGIIYPTFPTEYIKNSGSLIITDLISKGVIT